jgi:UDP-GlcNAc:undecaprenyl-phosphate GlcNAc-1-phosphate transferase
MKTYLLTYALAFLMATGLTPLVITWARDRELVDLPDLRKIHSRPVARLGGIAIFAGFMLAVVPLLWLDSALAEVFRTQWLEIAVMFAGASVMFAVGLWDDLHGLRVRTKLLGQLAAAGLVCLAGIHIDRIVVKDLVTLDLGNAAWLFTFLWIIGVTNAVNLIDGLDGLAAGICAIACGAIAILAVLQGNVILALTMLALFGSLTGFLLFNFYPARIFMGDSGSLFLGFMVAVASVLTAAKSETLVGFGLPVLVLGIPIFDTLLSILRRFLNRRGIMSPDRGHFHHRLLDRGFQQHHVAVMAYLMTAAGAGVGLALLITQREASLAVFLFGLMTILLVFRAIGSVALRKTLQGIRDRVAMSQTQRIEQKKYEVADMAFGTVTDIEDYWQCMCHAAGALGLSGLTMEMNYSGSAPQIYTWQAQSPDWALGLVSQAYRSREVQKDCLEMTVPVRGNEPGRHGVFKLCIEQNGSLESAGRRAALFVRLAEEHRLDDVPQRH